MDFYLDEKFLNFEDPPREIFHAREEPLPNRFTIKQLESLVNEFIVSSSNGFIKNEYFVDLMISRTRNAEKFADDNGVPAIWGEFKRSDYELIIKSFDIKLSGYVSLKKVALVMCLMSSTIPNDDQIKQYKNNLIARKDYLGDNAEPLISKDNFINCQAWFDENEKNNDRPNSYAYPRVKNLKSIIFDTVKEDNNLVSINEYITLLNIKIPGKSLEIYADVLYSETDNV